MIVSHKIDAGTGQQIIARAHKIAELSHRGQVRKYSSLPYIVHPEAVAAIVASVTSNPAVISAAALHDTVEDTDLTLSDLFQQLYAQFGFSAAYQVTRLVDDLTHVFTKDAFPALNRAERKALEHDRLSRISPDAALVKLADIIHNTQDIVRDDRNFAKVYLVEQRELVEILAKFAPSPALINRARNVVESNFAQL